MTLIVAALASTLVTVLSNLLIGGQMYEMGAAAWLAQGALHLLICAGLGSLGVGVAQLGRRRPKLAVGVAAALIVAPGWVMGRALASGAWISQQSWSWLVVYVPALGLALALAVLAWILLREDELSARWGWLSPGLHLLLPAAALVAFVADAVVMPSLHPTFHLMVSALGSLASVLALHRLIRSRASTSGRSFVALAVASSLVLASLIGWVAMPQRVRSRLAISSPLALAVLQSGVFGRGQRIGSLFADASQPLARDAVLPRGLLTVDPQMNVLIVMVDTLRADAVPPVRKQGLAFTSEKATPFLNEWHEQAYSFELHYAQATVTQLSLASMFRSLESFEDLSLGESLPVWMRRHGRATFGVTTQFFTEGHFEELTQLTRDFDRIATYDYIAKQNDAVKTLEAELDATDGRPWFGWLHLYNMHWPYWAGSREVSDKGSRIQRYRRALGWLDARMREVVEVLEQRGMADNTIVIFASDHGEALGEHGAKSHGPKIYEEGIHVPLYIYVPGLPGGKIRALTANYDVFPTLVELLGEPLDPAHRGRSLVSLMAGAARDWERTIYSTAWKRKTAALIEGRDKLIYDSKADLFMRFDLERDPDEEEDLFDPEGEVDRRLLSQMLEMNPTIFLDELQEPERMTEVVQRLEAIDPASPSADLPSLLRVAGVVEDEGIAEAAARIFEGSNDPQIRAMVLGALSNTALSRANLLLSQALADADEASATALITALADNGQLAVATRSIARELELRARRDAPQTWRPWLRLIQPWARKSSTHFGKAYLAMLEGLGEASAVEVGLARLVLRAVATSRRKLAPELSAALLPYLRHLDVGLRVDASNALSIAGGPEALAELDRLRQDESIRVRYAALNAALVIDPAGAEARILEHSDDVFMTWRLVQHLKRHGTSRSLPFLRHTEEHSGHRFARRDARKLVKKLSGESGEPGK